MDDTTITPVGDDAAPVDNAPMSEDEGDRAIENFLSGGALPKGDNAAEEEAPTGSDTPDGDDEELVIHADDDPDQQQDEKAPAPATVGDDFMVTLQDGQQISLGDLKRNNLFQRDYTFKLEGHKKQVQEFEAWKSAELQKITQHRDQVLAYAEQHMPQPPDPSMMDQTSPNYDPIGYMEQQHQYQQVVGRLNAISRQKQAEQLEAQRHQEAEAEQRRQYEKERLFLALPKLRDKEKQSAFFADVRKYVPEVYNLDANEILELENSGAMMMVHDAIEYRKALARGKAAVKDLPGKPRLEGRQRSTPQTQQARDAQGRFEALRKTGSVEAADRAIEAFFSR